MNIHEILRQHKFRQNWCRWHHSKQNDLTKTMRLFTYPETYEKPSKIQLFHPRPTCSKFIFLLIFLFPPHSYPHLRVLWYTLSAHPPPDPTGPPDEMCDLMLYDPLRHTTCFFSSCLLTSLLFVVCRLLFVVALGCH